MTKFGKHRSVDDRYWVVPIKYCSEVPNSRKVSYEATEFDEEACKEAIKKKEDLWGTKFSKMVIKKMKKFDFVIMDIMGNNLVCAWRNSYTGRVGRPFLCCKATRNGKDGFIYKNKFYSLETKYGWVF